MANITGTGWGNGTNCPTNAVADDLPIPQNITYAVIPGTNASDPWMVNCCVPNPVHVVDSCWEWCAIPPKYTNSSMSSDDISSGFDFCLETAGRNNSNSNGLLIHIGRASSGGATHGRVTVAGAAAAALAVSFISAWM